MARLTGDERRDLCRRAATLFERLGSLGLDRGCLSTQSLDRDADLLNPWIRTFSLGDQEAFRRRLLWDGLTEEAVGQAMTSQVVAGSCDWTEWIDSIAGEAAAFAPFSAGRSDARSSDELYRAAHPEVPFREILVPLVAAARARLASETRQFVGIAPAARLDFEKQLLKEIATYAELAIYQRFDAYRGGKQRKTSNGRYRAFVVEMLHGGLVSMLMEHPVLARNLALMCSQWVGSIGELLERLTADREAIGRLFGGGDAGELRRAEPGLSDRHGGGRRVAALTLGSGLRLIYKPRDVGLERAYNEVLRWANRRGLLPALRTLKVLPREGYGWVEWVWPGAQPGRQAAADYYRQCGSLIFIAHLLRGQDLHMENVVASREGPVLIDTEMLLQPDRGKQHPGDHPMAGRLREIRTESCLSTGLLILLQTDGRGEVVDLGGLRGRGGGEAPIARRSWRHLGTDGLHFVRDATFSPPLRNQVLLGEVIQRPEDYATEIMEGFARCYRLFLAERNRLPKGLASWFGGERSRLLLRNSTQYGALLYVLTAPSYQSDGVRRSIALDALNRGFCGERERPLLWPLVADERAALEELDIPRFSVGTTETSLRSKSGTPVAGYFTESGLAAVERRLRSLSPRDLDAQLCEIRRALQHPLDGRFVCGTAPDKDYGACTSRLVESAVWIGREFLARAVEGEDGALQWPEDPSEVRPIEAPAELYLYQGLIGVPIFLSALGAITEEKEWKDAARCSLKPVEGFLSRKDLDDRLEPEPVGGTDGLGSLVYGLSLASHFLEDGRYLELAFRVARNLSPERIARDDRFDVVGGAAGALLSLLALYREREEPWVLDRAIACAQHLLTRRTRPGRALAAWRIPEGVCLAGFAHGASGIAHALLELYRFTGQRELLEVVAAAFRYERSLFSRRHRNWPIVTPGGLVSEAAARMMVAWCHGAPGIGLARSLAADAMGGEAIQEEVEIAMTTTAGAARHPAEHLCCGNLGRSEALLVAGHRCERLDWVAAAEALAEKAVESATVRGHFGLPSTEFDYRIFAPGFFKGLSGIGYQLLRTASPGFLPSVLVLQPSQPLMAEVQDGRA